MVGEGKKIKNNGKYLLKFKKNLPLIDTTLENLWFNFHSF